MIRIEKSVKKAPSAVIAEAERRFGRDGLGLDVSKKEATCLDLTGGGGFISVTACVEDQKTKVEATSREWDSQVKSFIADL